MPNVTGRIVKPSGTAGGPANGTRVRFRLVDSAGNKVRQAWDTGTANRVIAGDEDFGLDAEGDYTVTLAPNTQIEPSGTRWQRVVLDGKNEGPALSMVVPVGGGPYNEHTIRDEAVDALPVPEPSNEQNAAERTSNLTVGSFNGFNIIAVTGMVVTVPDLDRPCYIDCQLWMEHAATANANLATMIGVTGLTTIGTQIAAAIGFVGAQGKETSPFARARIPAHSPGTYQAYVYSDTSGNVNTIASTANPLKISVLAV
jgi:hypothetical protein